MKILFILHYPPPLHGSAVVGCFIKESKIINGNFDCRFINLGISAAIEEIGYNSIRKISRYFSLICHVIRELINFRPDFCYFTPVSKGIGFYKDALIISIVKLFGIRTIFHYHNKGVCQRQECFFDNLLYRFVFRKTTIILLSRHLYPDIQKYVPERKVYYCPNGIPDLKDKRQKGKDNCESGYSSELKVQGSEQGDKHKEEIPSSPNYSKISPDNPEILFFSHLIKSKGVLVLFDACYLLKERGMEFHCTIAGGDAEMTWREIEELIKDKGLATFISIVGQKHGEEKEQLLKLTDIFVHPSYNDCLPLVLLEAMQYSLPVVSTFEGAIPDVVEDGITGFLVPQMNSVAVADKIELLIKDPELRYNMGTAGRARYEREFTLERFEKRMAEILQEIGNA